MSGAGGRGRARGRGVVPAVTSREGPRGSGGAAPAPNAFTRPVRPPPLTTRPENAGTLPAPKRLRSGALALPGPATTPRLMEGRRRGRAGR